MICDPIRGDRWIDERKQLGTGRVESIVVIQQQLRSDGCEIVDVQPQCHGIEVGKRSTESKTSTLHIWGNVNLGIFLYQ
jgi:hypothetical protein